GHSTSGSHERYKSERRLAWEKEYDCNRKFREWILENNIAAEEQLASLEKDIKKQVRTAKKEAWAEFLEPQKAAKKELVGLLEAATVRSPNKGPLRRIKNDLIAIEDPLKKDLASQARKALRYLAGETHAESEALGQW